MSKRKDINYQFARKNLYEKDLFLNNYIDDMLTKCNQMFVYTGLPDTVPKRILEKYLTENGDCIFTKYNDKFVILIGGAGGELNEYYEPTKYIVANPYLKLTKEYIINTENDDCVLMRNDCKSRGLLPLLSKYAVLCNDCEISINMLTNNLRTQYLISAGDNKTKENADIFIKKLIDGDFSCIAENTFLDGVKVHNVVTNASYIKDFIELNQYLKATAFNEIGLDANYNMKRERLTAGEVELNTSILIPLADDMLEQRRIAIDAINKKYGLNITVDLSSVWKMQKETVEKATAEQNTITPADETPPAPPADTVPPADTETPPAETDADKVPPADTENDNGAKVPPADTDENRQRLIKEIETLDADFFNNVDVNEMSNDDLQTALDNMTAKNNGGK